MKITIYKLIAKVFGIKKSPATYRGVPKSGIIYERNGRSKFFNKLVRLYNNKSIGKSARGQYLYMDGDGVVIRIFPFGVSPYIVYYKDNKPYRAFNELLAKQPYSKSKLFFSSGVPLMYYITEDELVEVKRWLSMAIENEHDYDSNILGDDSPYIGGGNV